MPEEKISGVPLDRVGDTFSTFNIGLNPGMGDAIVKLNSMLSGDAWCAFLTGGYGTGKTHLAIAAMNAYGIRRSWFWKVPDYLDFIRRMHFDRGISIDEITRSYRTSDFLLVMDDLGVENPTDWAAEQLYRVIDSRYDNRLPTVITTNVSAERLDQRLLSRCASGLVVCKGKDLRR